MKKLIALAVAGAFIAPAAFADSKNVEIYGIATAGLEKTNDAAAGGVGQTKVEDFGSRIGFKGSEDLGGGLKAIFKIESSVALDVGGTTLASREGHVGIAGNFGAVLAGRGKTPYQLATEAFDPFNSNNTLDITGGAVGTYVARANNWVAYASPNVQGLEVVGAYVFGEDKGLTAKDLNADGDTGDAGETGSAKKALSAISISAKYTMGDVAVIGAVQQLKNNGFSDDKSTDVLLGATYAIGRVAVGAAVNSSKETASDTKRTSLLANATYTTEPSLTLKAGVIAFGESEAAGVKQGDKATEIILGAQYDLSKRTNAFAELSNVKPQTGDTERVISVGVAHSF